MSRPQTTWKTLVLDAISSLPRSFTLAQITARKEHFARYYPDNRFIEAKIRQSLQVLRDQGLVRFCGNGRYERIDAQPVFSPLLDAASAHAYSNRSQVARVMLETWAELNLYCLDCAADGLGRMPANTPVADFECRNCAATYQLKGKGGRFGATIPGAAYRPTVQAIRDGQMPAHVLVEYDLRFATVVFVDAIPGPSITEERVIARKPLRASTRRAGWQGCTIHIAGLQSARIVHPAGVERRCVREQWRTIQQA